MAWKVSPVVLVLLMATSCCYCWSVESNQQIVTSSTATALDFATTDGSFNDVVARVKALEKAVFKRVSSCQNATASGNYMIPLVDGSEVEVFCEMSLLGGGWTIIGRMVDSPSDATFLWDPIDMFEAKVGPFSEATFGIPIRNLDFPIAEMIFGIGNTMVTSDIHGMHVSANFDQLNALSPLAVPGETCIETDAFVSPAATHSTRKQYGYKYFNFDKSLITERNGYTAVDMAKQSNCGSVSGSATLFCMYRNSVYRTCLVGNVSPSGSFSYNALSSSSSVYSTNNIGSAPTSGWITGTQPFFVAVR